MVGHECSDLDRRSRLGNDGLSRLVVRHQGRQAVKRSEVNGTFLCLFVPCPLAVAPAGGWPGGVQGPAFVVETAACLNQCFFNVSADGSIASGC